MAERSARRGPQAVSDPDQDQRAQVAEIQDQAREDREQAAADAAAAAEPVGPPIGQEMRQAVIDAERRSAEQRAAEARARRRTPAPVSDPDDEEREQVGGLLADARERQVAALAERGIADPAIEAQSAGYPPELGETPQSDLYGPIVCELCGNTIERSHPGYPDLDAAARDVVCPHCGQRQGQGQGQGGRTSGARRGRRAAARDDASAGTLPPAQDRNAPGQATPVQDAEGSQPATPATPLTNDERAELEQFRAAYAARERAEQQQPEGEAGRPANADESDKT